MKKSAIVTLALLAVFAATLLLSGCSSAPAGVGVVDINKVMSDSPKIKQFQDQLNVKGKELSDQLEKDKASITPEEFQKRQEKAYGDFMTAKQDLEGQIDASVKETLDQIAKEKKLGIVLYKNSVAQGGTDVTPDVIQKMQ
jgi:outer membrane protein